MTPRLTPLEEKITTVINSFKDPLTQQPLKNQCFLQIQQQDQNLYLTLTVPTGHEQSYQALQQELTESIQSLPEVQMENLKIFIVLTAAKPVPYKKVIAIASGKGGVGKSTTAIYLAYALSQTGLRIGLMDGDIYGPSLPTLIGRQEKPQVNANKHMIPIEKDGIQFISMGFLLEEDKPIIWRGPMVSQAIQQFLQGVAWNNLDILIIDLPPGTGDIQLTLIQHATLTGAIIVTTPQDLALVDARKALAMFEKVSIPIIGVVENMSYFVCPHCHERSDIFSHEGAQTLNAPLLANIPLLPAIRALCDAGNPQELLSMPEGQTYHHLARQVMIQLISDVNS